ncbi:hypothetical protein E2C01_045164 [Portunus trituberculatus]|uniref:Uncharacterized protein n=1 Tax=Portunus trituberculatus TaxID=210409 RepID=A0A5B7FU75_PORTR|nr:hypothetical protein [Portunus trituberculatus]
MSESKVRDRAGRTQHEGDGPRMSKALSVPCITPRAKLTRWGTASKLSGGSGTLINKRGLRLMQGEPRVFNAPSTAAKHVKANELIHWNDKWPPSNNTTFPAWLNITRSSASCLIVSCDTATKARRVAEGQQRGGRDSPPPAPHDYPDKVPLAC